MIAFMIIHSGFGEGAFGRDVTVDAATWLFVPGDVEGAQLRKEVKVAVGQVVVNPPG